MIINNTIMFGYGDIRVASEKKYTISFQQYSKPIDNWPKANPPSDAELIGEKITLELTWADYITLGAQLVRMEERGSFVAFHFKGYIFDFSNYNAASILAVRKQLNKAFSSMVLAC